MIKYATNPAIARAATMGTAKMRGVPITPPNTSDRKVVGSTVAAAKIIDGEVAAVGVAHVVVAKNDDDAVLRVADDVNKEEGKDTAVAVERLVVGRAARTALPAIGGAKA